MQALKGEAEKAKDRIEELEAQAKTNQSNFDKVSPVKWVSSASSASLLVPS